VRGQILHAYPARPFGKERRKVMQSQARFGAGGDHVPYKSSWVLYEDLIFLADYIQPRR